MGRLVVASYCSTFLKPEMLHVYRQITALRRVETFVMANTVENARRFPFDDIEKIPRPHRNYLRHGWMKFIERRPPLIYRGEYQALIDILQRRRAQVMHIYFGHTGVHLLPFIREWRKPCLVSFHGADIGLNAQVANYESKLRVLFDSVAAVLARSQSIARRLMDIGCAPEKIQINRTGIPLRDFAFIRREFPREGNWRVLQACRLIDKKGVATAIRAFSVFARRFPAAQFHIAGKGDLQTQLSALAEQLGILEKVRFVGFLGESDLRNLCYRSHIFLHPSETPTDQNQEGVPNSMLEAMATGLPVVATRHGGIPEAVTDGVNGYLCDERDAEALGQRLIALADSPARYHSFSKAARDAVSQNFDQERAVRALERVYENVAHIHPLPVRLHESESQELPLVENAVAK